MTALPVRRLPIELDTPCRQPAALADRWLREHAAVCCVVRR